MANHISNLITISNVNEAVRNEISRIFKLSSDNLYDTDTSDLIAAIFDKPEYTNESYDREWVIENCGAKWFYGNVDDDTGDEIFISITSAWDPINPLLEVLTHKLVKINDKVVIESIFEDEGWNFAGVFYGSKEYTNSEYINMDDWDINRFYTGEAEDDDYRDTFSEALNNMIEIERSFHNYTILKETE